FAVARRLKVTFASLFCELLRLGHNGLVSAPRPGRRPHVLSEAPIGKGPPDLEQARWKGRPVAFEAAASVGKIFATYSNEIGRFGTSWENSRVKSMLRQGLMHRSKDRARRPPRPAPG